LTDVRAFTAIELSPDILAPLTRLTEKFKGLKISGVRWSAVENIHLTLRFLGDTAPEKLNNLKPLLQAAADEIHPFPLEVKNIGAFPNVRRPRVIWIGVQAPPELNRLQALVEQAVNQMGIAHEEHGFSPHLTIGRVRNEISAAELAQLLPILAGGLNIQPGSMVAASFTLFKSDLTPRGPNYTRLAVFKFGSSQG
jgi:2'-5' RNA ligase